MDSGNQKLRISDVRDSVLEHIKRVGVMPGARIPTERELQALLGVSRSRIRDALAALESDGTILRLIGDGTYLRTTQPRGGTDTPAFSPGEAGAFYPDQISPSQLIEARLVFEVGLVPFVVRNATKHDFGLIKEVLDVSENAQSGKEFEQLDTRYHHLIAVAAHNDLLTQFSHVISRGRVASGWCRLKKQSYTPTNRRTYQDDHRRIFEALTNRDADAAAAALQQHLAHTQMALLGL